jgi:hypothetical protein
VEGVDPATRTEKIRTEVENRGDLKLGMFVSVTTAGPGSRHAWFHAPPGRRSATATSSMSSSTKADSSSEPSG